MQDGGDAHLHLTSVLEPRPAAFSASGLRPQEPQAAVPTGPDLHKVESGLGLPRRVSQHGKRRTGSAHLGDSSCVGLVGTQSRGRGQASRSPSNGLIRDCLHCFLLLENRDSRGLNWLWHGRCRQRMHVDWLVCFLSKVALYCFIFKLLRMKPDIFLLEGDKY